MRLEYSFFCAACMLLVFFIKISGSKVFEAFLTVLNPYPFVGYLMSQKNLIFVRVKEKLVVPGLQMCTFCSPSHPDDKEHGNNAR